MPSRAVGWPPSLERVRSLARAATLASATLLAAFHGWLFIAQAADGRLGVYANVLIALGAILPGIGGTATRMGYVEVLYVTELVGLLLTWAGYRMSVSPSPLAQRAAG